MARRPEPIEPAKPTATQPRGQRTRAAILSAARQLFVDPGYFETGTDDILVAAGVRSRGALYHHFPDKRAIFAAVIDQAATDLTARIMTTIDDPTDALDHLRLGLAGYLEAAATDRETQRIVLIDGPAVLGWSGWRALVSSHGPEVIEVLLQRAVDDGVIADQPVEPLAHMLLAAANEAGLVIAHHRDPEQVKRASISWLNTLIDGLRLAR